MKSESTLLEVDKVAAGYSGSMVIFDVSMQVPRGTFAIIVGRNGAGKSTLLRTIAGFMKPISGQIILNGQVISGIKPYQIARLGIKYIPQDKKAFEDLSVRDNLRFSIKRGSTLGFEPAFEVFPKLRHLLDSRARELSGGEKQMLLLAQGILAEPDVLLVDEPSEGLAPEAVSDLADGLGVLKEKHVTAIIVEQNLGLVESLADSVHLMKDGRLNVAQSVKEALEKL